MPWKVLGSYTKTFLLLLDNQLFMLACVIKFDPDFACFISKKTLTLQRISKLIFMRQLKFFFILIIMLALPCLVIAEQKSGSSKSRPPILLTKSKCAGPVNRPKAPDRQSVKCTYDGMCMDLNFTVSEGEAILMVSDETSQCLTYTIDTSTLYVSVPVGTLSGSISIELDTELGNHFTGTIGE